MTLAEMEKRHIQYALGKLSDNYFRTAQALGISRNTLKRKIEEYGLKHQDCPGLTTAVQD